MAIGKATMGHVDGVTVPVAAIPSRDAWADDVPDGTLTAFRRVVAAAPGATVVLSWIEWPSRAACHAGMATALADPRMQPGGGPIPLDGERRSSAASRC